MTETNKKGLRELIEDVCLAVDEFAKDKLTPGTPIYQYQQCMISAVKTYREAKIRKETEGVEL